MGKEFCDLFNCMPLAAVIDEKYFCVHSGLSPEITRMDQIHRSVRPVDVPDTGLICDLLWSDPLADISGWTENDRGISFGFGPDVVTSFLQKHDLDLVVRSRQIVEDGWKFFAKRQLITIYSSHSDQENEAAVMLVSEDLFCSFKKLAPGGPLRRQFTPRGHSATSSSQF